MGAELEWRLVPGVGRDVFGWYAVGTGASWWVMSGGDVFRVSKLMGHADVKITQKTYAHLAPEAWHQDYHRLACHVPTEPARVFEIVRGHRGELAGRRSITVDARETADPGAAVRVIRPSSRCRSP